MTRRFLLFVLAIAMATSTFAVNAANNPAPGAMIDSMLTQKARLTAPAGAPPGDEFGYDVDISGKTLVIGARLDSVQQGAVYVFEHDGTSWNLQQKLTAREGRPYDTFGSSVAISGKTIVVGAPGRRVRGNNRQGAAFVFERCGTSWIERPEELLADDGEAGDMFGESVAINGDTIAVGTRFADAKAGAAYVFERCGARWGQGYKLTASDRAAGDVFGLGLAIGEDSIVVGAPLDNDKGGFSGSAYVFERIGTRWVQRQKLTASEGVAGDLFGSAVAINGETIVVSALLDDTKGVDAGAAYIFERHAGSWSQRQKLTANDGKANSVFGIAVALSAEAIVIGASRDNEKGANAGAVYVFERCGTNQQKLVANEEKANDLFGTSVAVSGRTVAAGSPSDLGLKIVKGSAYIFQE